MNPSHQRTHQRLEHAASTASPLTSLPADLLTLVADELVEEGKCLAKFAAVCTRTLAAARVALRATSSTPQAQVVRLIGRPAPSVSRVQPCGAEGKLDDARGQVGNKRLNFGDLPRAPKAPVDSVDAADASDPQCIVPYLQDIYRHYREAEVRRSQSLAEAPHCGRPTHTVAGARARTHPHAPLMHVHTLRSRPHAPLTRQHAPVAGAQAPLALVHEQAD